MKSSKLIIPAMAVMAAAAASCSQEPLQSVNPAVEEYTREFIKDFGLPAPGHDFAMATSAGLKVRTASDTHITVTAEIDGKEYLFADLNVPAGTHALPVTIPRSVTSLKVKAGMRTFEAGVNDLVDIDNAMPASRGVEIVNNPSFAFIDNDNEAPVIVFSPDDFLNDYLRIHSGSADCTNKWYMGKDQGLGYIDPWIHDSIYVHYGEVGLGATDVKIDENNNAYMTGLHYLVFPVWWNTDRYGNKDYVLNMCRYDIANNKHSVPFNDPDNGLIPFPQLGYSESEVAAGEVMDNLAAFTYDDGSFSRAYDPEMARTVVSKGVKVDMQPDSWDNTAFRFDLWAGGGNYFSSTVPYWNRKVWGEKYFDQTLSDLMYTTVSTELYLIPGQKFKVLNYPVNTQDKDTDYCSLPFLVGFNSQPSGAADTDPRHYTDLILLVLPTHGLQLFYNIAETPEPFVWTMAVEDLGGTDDWDFNDVVFHFTDVIKSLNTVNGNKMVTCISGPLAATAVRTIDVWPVATGGTMPIYITFTGTVAGITPIPEWGDMMFSEANGAINDALTKVASGTFVLGTEVHSWLGAEHYTQFVNVDAVRTGREGKTVEFVIPPYADLSYSSDQSYGSSENKPLYGFTLLVDKDNTLGIDALNDEDMGVKLLPDVTLGEGTYLIGAPDENGSIAPQMLLIADGDWQWPTERTKISDAYPGFTDWITNITNSDWIKNPVEEKITKKQ